VELNNKRQLVGC